MTTASQTTTTPPRFGSVAEARDFFIRAFHAMEKAERWRDYEARYLADKVIASIDDEQSFEDWHYRQAVAAHQYAEAVYEVEAAPIRARAEAAA